jgi:hypothetical protein
MDMSHLTMKHCSGTVFSEVDLWHFATEYDSLFEMKPLMIDFKQIHVCHLITMP